MDITVTHSLLLVAVLALLMVNYATRRIATAQASRMFVKDHLKNIRHHKHAKTMLVLRSRLSLMATTIALTSLGAFFGLISVVFVILEWALLAEFVFVAGVLFGAIGLLLSMRESSIANRSHFGELDATVSKDDPYYSAGAP